MPACPWVKSPRAGHLPCYFIFAPQSHKDFQTCPMLCGMGEHPAGSCVPTCSVGDRSTICDCRGGLPGLAFKSGAARKLLDTDPSASKSCRWEASSFFLAAGWYPTWGQLQNRQGQPRAPFCLLGCRILLRVGTGAFPTLEPAPLVWRAWGSTATLQPVGLGEHSWAPCGSAVPVAGDLKWLFSSP